MRQLLLVFAAGLVYGQTILQQNYDTRAHDFNITVGSGVSGDLSSAGAKTVTFAVCPKGVSGSDLSHPIYLHGGIGDAETPLITGGTCTPGARSKTIAFTTLNGHSGTWIISSAAGGVPEALSAGQATGGVVVVSGSIAVHAAITIPSIAASGEWIIQGSGGWINNIHRATDYPAGDLLFYDQYPSGQSKLTIRDLTIYGGGAYGTRVHTTSGAAIHIKRAGSLATVIDNCYIDSGFVGVDIDSSSNVSVQRSIISDGDDYVNAGFVMLAGIRIRYSGVGTTPSGVYVAGVAIASNGAVAASADAMQNAVLIEASDGVYIHDNAFGAVVTGIGISVSNAKLINIIKINNNVMDTFTAYCIHMYGDGVGTPALVDSLVISNNHIGSRYDVSSNFNGDGVVIDNGSYLQRLDMTGNWIAFNGKTALTVAAFHGIESSGGATITGNNIHSNNLSNVSGAAALTFGGSTYANLSINANHIYNTGLGLDDYGIYVNGTLTRSTISGNDFHDHSGGHVMLLPVYAVGAITSSVIANNGGIDDVIGSVADAATIAWPLNPNVVITGSGTTVAAVTMTGIPAGARGTFRTTGGAIPFTATGGIGTAGTTTQNKLYQWQWDGTALWWN
jgi:hypothetical protein